VKLLSASDSFPSHSDIEPVLAQFSVRFDALANALVARFDRAIHVTIDESVMALVVPSEKDVFREVARLAQLNLDDYRVTWHLREANTGDILVRSDELPDLAWSDGRVLLLRRGSS
jgi:hypothetical protein